MCRAWIALLVILILGLVGSYRPQQQDPEWTANRHTIPCQQNSDLESGTRPPVDEGVSDELQQTAQQHQECTNNPQQHWWQNPGNTNALIALFTFFTVIVGAIQASVYYAQKNLMRDALRETQKAADAAVESANVTKKMVGNTEKSAKQQLRAYVHVFEAFICSDVRTPDEVLLKGMIEAGRLTIGIVAFRNAGKTPAHNVVISGAIDIVSWPLRSEKDLRGLNFDDPNNSRTILGPKMEQSQIMPSSRPIFPAELDALKKGTAAIFVHGEARYEDAFGDHWFTKYRYFTGGIAGLPGTSLAPHHEGNEAT